MAKGPDAFRTISEAAAEVGVAPHVLRFWETRFSFIKPMTRAGGRRFYRPGDVAVLRIVRALLYDRRLSIRAVQTLHRTGGVRSLAKAIEAHAPAADDPAEQVAMLDAPVQARLRSVLADLERLREKVDRTLAGD